MFTDYKFTKLQFIKSLGIMAALPLALKAKRVMEVIPTCLPPNGGNDEWEKIRSDYKLKPDYINLESGYYSIMAQPVLDAYFKDLNMVNLEGSYYMRTVQNDRKEEVTGLLAEFLGCDKEELIITRNTTESLDTVIAGYDWKPGDEAVMAEQDYGSMLDMFKQQAKRHGMVNKTVSVPLNPKSDEEIVKLYSDAITSKTRLLMVCHMINITGQILPVKKICDMAHGKGVDVMVDGAHTVAHLDFKIRDLNCDYFGTSLHKWLGAPMGVGALYVRREKIKQLWPLYADAGFADDNIHKLNHTGTHPVAADLAIKNAIDYHTAIGSKKKEDRLRFLQNYWTNKVRGVKNIILNTPDDPKRSCAIANVGVENIKPADLAKTLLDKYKIWTVAIDGAGVHGVRITLQLFTSTVDLDQLVDALKEIARG